MQSKSEIFMDKRYQVFVSSTYSDLIDARHSIMMTLMKMDCIPAGMEHFPAADEEQWTFIKRIIDHSDYYLLIIAGRYGSLDSDGVSFTEKEYDYAVQKNIKIIALVHEKPDEIPFQYSEQAPELRIKLGKFREKVKKGRMVDFWKKPEELTGKVAVAVLNARNLFPAVGWVRANTITDNNALIEINEVRKENNQLLLRINELEKEPNKKPPINLVDLDSVFTMRYQGAVMSSGRESRKAEWQAEITWKEIFFHISPMLKSYKNESAISKELALLAQSKTLTRGMKITTLQQDVYTIGIQLQSYGLIKVDNLRTTSGGKADFWMLTSDGRDLMMALRTIQ